MALALGWPDRGAGQTPPIAAQPAMRTYQSGPLTAADFRAAAPREAKLDALTVTELRYEYRYQTWTDSQGNCTLQLTQVLVETWLDRSRSWNRKPADGELLEHEQGHFEVTEAVRRKAIAYWKGRVKQVRLRRSSEKAARKAAGELVQREMAPFFERLRLMHALYDRETQHGRDTEQQRRWRQKLAAELAAPTAAEK